MQLQVIPGECQFNGFGDTQEDKGNVLWEQNFKLDMTYNQCMLLFLNDVLTQDHYFSRSLKHSVPHEKKRSPYPGILVPQKRKLYFCSYFFDI